MKKVLITGPLGQDGTILTDLLHNKYEIYGVCRMETDIHRLREHEKKHKIKLLLSDLSEIGYVEHLIKSVSPDIIINFAGETDVINPWQDVQKTFIQNFTIPYNILNTITKQNKDIFFFQSSSSLVYGRSEDKIINEKSKFDPLHPYGVSKMTTQSMISEYRNKYGIKCSSGIFFNHESYYRSKKFISKKLSLLVSDILKGKNKKIKLYDLNFYRDISHAEDFMKGVEIIIESSINEDFVFSSGNLINILEFSKKFFSLYNLNFFDYIDYEESKNYKNDYNLIGDNNKLRSIGWCPKYTEHDLIKHMINSEINNKYER